MNLDPFKEIVTRIAAKYNLQSNWIDTRPSEATFRDLPDYKPDLYKLEEIFNYLEPYIISKADSVLTKFAHFTNIRQWDRGDIKAVDFSDDDYQSVRKKLADLGKKDPERALRIEIEFKSVKPDFIRTDDGFSFSNSNEVAQYARIRYGIILDDSFKNQLDYDALNMRYSYEKAIIAIDTMALDTLIKSNLKKDDYEPGL